MPLQKAVTLPTSVVANFWRITKISVDSRTKFIEAVIGGFVDSAAYHAGALPLHEHIIVLGGQNLPGGGTPFEDVINNTPGLNEMLNGVAEILQPVLHPHVPQLAGATVVDEDWFP